MRDKMAPKNNFQQGSRLGDCEKQTTPTEIKARGFGNFGKSSYANTNTNRVLYLMGAFFLLFAHWGVNEFLSVQFAFFLLVILKLRPFFLTHAKIIFFGLVAAFLFLGLSLAAGHDSHMMLKGLRTGLVISLLYAAKIAISQGSLQQVEARGVLVIKVLTLACAVALVVASGQLIDSLGPNTGLLDIPANYFALDYGTLFDESRSALSASDYFIRPSAFYSEPSGLALLGNISVLVGLFGLNKRLILLGFSTVLISFSLSGFLISVFIFGYYFFALERKKNELLSRSQLILISAIVLFVGLSLLGERLLNMGASSDESAAVRVFEPIRLLIDMFNRGEYFGMPPEILRLRMSLSVVTVFDNWVLNQFLYYGLLGFIPVIFLFYAFGRHLGLMVLVLGVTNGDLFYYDRLIFLMLLIVAAATFMRAKGRSR